MPSSLEEKLKPYEKKVLEAVRERGVKEAMSMFGVKTRSSFMGWLKSHRDGLFPANPLAGFAGGEKHKWLVEHKETIFDLIEVWGEDEVMEKFCLKEETLYSLRVGSTKLGYQKLGRVDRLEINMREALNTIRALNERLEKMELQLDIKNERWKDIKRQNEEIREACTDFAQTTAKRVAEVLILPLLQHLAPTDDRLRLQEPDLSIDSLLAQGEKRAKKEAEQVAKEKAKREAEKKAKNGTAETTPVNPLLRKVYMLAHPLANNEQTEEG